MTSSVERLGELLVRMGALEREHIAEILSYQNQHPSMKFGEIAVKLGYVSEERLGPFLSQHNDN